MFYNTFSANFNYRVLMEASNNRALPTELGYQKLHIVYKQMTPTESLRWNTILKREERRKTNRNYNLVDFSFSKVLNFGKDKRSTSYCSLLCRAAIYPVRLEP